MSTVTTETGAYSLEEGWRTLALAGAVVAILGLLAMILPVATGIAITYVIGAMLVLGGVVHGAHAYTARGWTGTSWQVVLAAVSIAAGILLLVNPIIGLMTITLLAIGYLIVDGLAELGTSLRMGSGSGRGWIAASGVLSLVLAVFLFAGFPVTAAWFVGFVVGASLLFTGLSMVGVAYGGRHLEEDVTPPAAEPRGA
ncbi:HdeD family acid-resistance protein [Natronosalvus vescus]|uniref:HdeD family acid-resistance protein n=1 Tax=Natronosalvus vescus TaxID=2953881 RepID=UPI002091A1FF|nr:HdeD family acid-resistance protein [Natronosalvus vescus]